MTVMRVRAFTYSEYSRPDVTLTQHYANVANPGGLEDGGRKSTVVAVLASYPPPDTSEA